MGPISRGSFIAAALRSRKPARSQRDHKSAPTGQPGKDLSFLRTGSAVPERVAALRREEGSNKDQNISGVAFSNIKSL